MTHVVHIGFGVVLIGGLVCGWWISMHPELLDRVRPGAGWLLSALVLMKIVAATWVLRASHRRRLTAPRQAAAMIAAWCLAVAALSIGAVWWLPLQTVPTTAAVTGIVLFVPFSRLAGAALALSWNRHR